MWPFTKKIRQAVCPPVVACDTVLCIPGIWKDVEDIANTVFSVNEGTYMVVGDLLIHPQAAQFYKFEIKEQDENMAESFERLGKTTGITTVGLSKIRNHNYVIYITGKTGSFNEAHQIALAGAAILKAGGLGIRIDTTGKAFEQQKWLKYLINFVEADLFEMFVTNSFIDERNIVFSRGMHNLGLKDILVCGEELQKAVDLINVFGYYQVFDKPVIHQNEFFQPGLQSARYLITEEINQFYSDNKLFNNPFGMWKLRRFAH
ncbi:hypothetical protein [Mucilaginibacter gotjawali]|uniref:Uncharacterized protein n=2 Tax=Mucilaginibacter gotjawali TaxID=1550579 RepID=A0A110B308_9SPHI|nr:hypothetical protein [Mucilaginibacter gotjawali]MBB3054146.1 hypothetical protein [Mucilaginibacter gotjawali]BAU54417.1 hypothetical protein MgSA37_02593 [Mucilaginibacter gotjawali]